MGTEESSREAILDRWTIQLAETLRRRWLAIGAAAVAGGAAAYALSFTQPVLYKATAVAVHAERTGMDGAGMLGQLEGVAALAGISVGGNNQNAESLATLRSRQFADAFLQEAGLVRRLCELHCEDMLEAPVDEQRLRIRAIGAFESKVRRVQEDKLAGLVEVSVIWPDGTEAATFANRLFAAANEVLRQRARADAEANLRYLNAELDKTVQVELRQALYRLVERQTAQIMSANVTADYAFRVIDPALAPDAAFPESPRRMVWAAAGTVLGGALALGLALFAWRRGR